MNENVDHSVLHFGIYRGEKWGAVPLSYLYWVANNSGNNFAKNSARSEIDRRRKARGATPHEWASYPQRS